MRPSWPGAQRRWARPPRCPRGRRREGSVWTALGHALPEAARHPAPDRGDLCGGEAVCPWRGHRPTPAQAGWHADRTGGTRARPTVAAWPPMGGRLGLDASRREPRRRRGAAQWTRETRWPAASAGHARPRGVSGPRDARAPAPSPPGAPPPERTAQAGPASGARPGGLGASRRRRPAAGGGARVPPPSPAPHGDARARTASASAPRGRSVAGRPLGPPGGRAARPSRTPPHAKSECRRFVHSCCSLGVCFGSDALDSGGALQLLVYP